MSRVPWGVQGRSDPQRELLDVDSVAGHLFHAHIVIEPDTGLITETELTKVKGPDTQRRR